MTLQQFPRCFRVVMCSQTEEGFCYGSVSLCEHITAVYTLAVIHSTVFTVDSTYSQCEVTPRSTATEPNWSILVAQICTIN